MARYRRRGNTALIVSAVATGLVLAHGHPSAPGHGHVTAAGLKRTGTISTSTTCSAGPGCEQLALMMASQAGWGSSSEQTCLDKLWYRETAYTWDPTIANPISGALGIAQALTHGGPGRGGTLGNEYGDYGLSDAEARLANSGNAYWQIRWGLDYISATYQFPCGAWGHEEADNWY